MQTGILPLPENKIRRSAYIADHLKSMIFDGQLKPGDRLPTEEQLCQQFNVSRTTLRESVQMLRVSGLLDVTPGRGSFVRLPKMENLLQDLTLLGRYGDVDGGDLCQTQILLFRGIMPRVASLNAKDKKALSDFVLKPENDPRQNIELEQSWKLHLMRLADSNMSRMLLSVLLNISEPWRLKALADCDEKMRTISTQLRVNEALINGDAETATRAMSSFLEKCK